MDIFEGFFNSIRNFLFGKPTVVVERIFLALVEGIANDEEEVEVVASAFILRETLEEDVFGYDTATEETNRFLEFSEEFSVFGIRC